MGREACAALDAASDVELVGGIVRSMSSESSGVGTRAGDVRGVALFDSLDELVDRTHPNVLVDFTHHPVTVDLAMRAISLGVSPVIGATGWSNAEISALDAHCVARGIGAAIVPNFALGAVLAMRFAAEAARWFPTTEIVELHHDGKRDKPSGTAKLTAHRIEAVAKREVPIHSVRLRGLVAHEEILFGGEGEILTIRHDSLSRTSFMPGMLLAVRGIGARTDLVIGLDTFLEART